MAKKRKTRRSRSFTFPVAIYAGISAPAVKLWEARGGGVSGISREAGRIFTGYDFWSGTWDAGNMFYGLLPVIGGLVVHKLVGGTLGLNRTLASAGIPFIRI